MKNSIESFPNSIVEIQNKIKELANQEGFELVGFAKAILSNQDRSNIESFIQKKYFASMDWFPKRQNIRMDLENLGFKPNTVIALGMVYRPRSTDFVELKEISNEISTYAWGEDYHHVLKLKAKPILKYLKDLYPKNKFRQGVDSLPLPEKIFARNAGLGWIGKNTLLINPKIGSNFFISLILSEVCLHLTDIDFIAEKNPQLITGNSAFKNGITNNISNEFKSFQPFNFSKDRCGSCTVCIDACPTKAIVAPYQLDANLCISHNTIEFKTNDFPDSIQTKGWIYGCDICQNVCPWNRVVATNQSVETKVNEFYPLPIFKNGKETIYSMDEKTFKKNFEKSAIIRIGFKNWRRNIQKKGMDSPFPLESK
jgi:epoxyqueuosine reductase